MTLEKLKNRKFYFSEWIELPEGNNPALNYPKFSSFQQQQRSPLTTSAATQIEFSAIFQEIAFISSFLLNNH
jgi:hypothetical protein